jgi:REP element-mobilizing transposase RayT
MEKRKSTRLKDYNYSEKGAYHITICALDKKCLFSKIIKSTNIFESPKVCLTEYGKIIDNQIEEMDKTYDDIVTDKYVIMPNHIHILLSIEKGSSGTPTPTNAILSKYVSTLKRMSNKKIGFNVWQRNYYDHIIRNEEDYLEHLRYIEENPIKWLLGKDEYYIK